VSLTKKATSKARKSPLRVNVGSTNPSKVKAVRDVFSDIFSKQFDVKVGGVEVDSGVAGEPWDGEVVKGARNRALSAIGKADFGVGIEAGLFRSFGEVLGVQYCVIVDKEGTETIGHGPGFRFPPKVLKEIEKGKTVSEAMEGITGIKDIGRKKGAVDHLTKGRLDRTELTRSAVLMAMVPRIRKDLY
jgi:inosine/xanthosine triphosphatase